MLRPLLDKTPYELIRGRPPSIAHLRIFGCKCYVHNNGKNQLGKFDPKSDKATFLGYSATSKAYKVLNTRTKKLEESIHVKFDERSILKPAHEEQDPLEAPLNPSSSVQQARLTSGVMDSDSDDDNGAGPSQNAPIAPPTLPSRPSSSSPSSDSDEIPPLEDDATLSDWWKKTEVCQLMKPLKLQ